MRKWKLAAALFAVATIGAAGSALADSATDVGLPSDPLDRDYACYAVISNEWQGIEAGDYSDYDQDELEADAEPWLQDAMKRTGKSADEVISSEEVAAGAKAAEALIKAGKGFTAQLDYCAEQQPE
jgi:hypothetical protein